MRNGRLGLGLAFISPWIAGFCLFTFYPLFSITYHSFCDYSVLTPAYFIGVRNYMDMATDGVFWQALGNTLLFAITYLPLSMVCALFLSLLLHLHLPGKGILRTIYFLPTIVPMPCLTRHRSMTDGNSLKASTNAPTFAPFTSTPVSNALNCMKLPFSPLAICAWQPRIGGSPAFFTAELTDGRQRRG